MSVMMRQIMTLFDEYQSEGERQAHPAGHEGERTPGLLERRPATTRLSDRGSRAARCQDQEEAGDRSDPGREDPAIYRLALNGVKIAGRWGSRRSPAISTRTTCRPRTADAGAWPPFTRFSPARPILANTTSTSAPQDRRGQGRERARDDARASHRLRGRVRDCATDR